MESPKKSLIGLAKYRLDKTITHWFPYFMMFNDPGKGYCSYEFGYSFAHNKLVNKFNFKHVTWPRYVQLFLKEASFYKFCKHTQDIGSCSYRHRKMFFSIKPS